MCLQMVLEANGRASESVAELTATAVAAGGYLLVDEAGQQPLVRGWFYAPLIEIASHRGFAGRIFVSTPRQDLCADVLAGRTPVVAVSRGVVAGEPGAHRRLGGHLVVVVGFEWVGRRCVGLYVHDPAGRRRQTQEAAFIPMKRFKAAYQGRGFVLWPIDPPG